jgi:uncharacterized protein YdeI (BOF family)
MQSRKNIAKLLVAAAVPTVIIATHAVAQEAQEAPDDSWVSISGTIVSTSPESFKLDHGEGVIKVEMDDFDFFQEGRSLLVNDQVIVYGVVDDDFYEKRTIEASSVFVEDLGTHFYANPIDEEDFLTWTAASPIDTGRVEMTGLVTSIDGREFTISNAAHRVQVDTAMMPFNPLDDKGYLRVDVGDWVKVGGTVDRALFDERELSADWIVVKSD